MPVERCELRGRRTVRFNVVRVEKNVHAAPDPEVPEKPQRRRFTAEYKLKIMREADECSPGEQGALLRREGLYSSHLVAWRRQRASGELAGLEPQKRGRKPTKRRDAVALENDRLRRENERLQKRLKQAEVIIDVQKKLANALGIELPNDEKNGSNE